MTLKRKHPFGLPEDRFTADGREYVMAMAKPHVHNQIEINLLVSGHAIYVYNGRRIRIETGDFVFFWGAIPHQVVHVGADTRFICLYLPLEAFMFSAVSTELKSAILEGGFVQIDERLDLDANLLAQTRRDLLSGDAVKAGLDARHIELRLRRADTMGWTDLTANAQAVSKTYSNSHRKVVEMVRFVSEHADQGICAEDVAGAVSLHPKYAMSLFRTSLGMTITQYLVRRRLVTAQWLLVSSDKSAAMIAFEAGFGSVSRFYAAFQNQVGLSPRAFRNLYTCFQPRQ